MSGLCCIVSARPVREGELAVPDGAFVIAADAGLRTLRAAGLLAMLAALVVLAIFPEIATWLARL